MDNTNRKRNAIGKTTVILLEAIWRRWKRPSPETLRTIRALESYKAPTLPASVRPGKVAIRPAEASFAALPPFPKRFSNHELEKYALQNAALLYVLESHEKSLSSLSPSALEMVKRALAPSSGPNSRAKIAA